VGVRVRSIEVTLAAVFVILALLAADCASALSPHTGRARRSYPNVTSRPTEPSFATPAAHPAPVITPIAFVQVNSTTLQTSENPVTATFTLAQTAGDLNVVVVSWNDSVTTIQSVTDSSGNAYSLAVAPTILSGTASQAIYYARNIAGAAANTNIVTVEFSEAAPFVDLRILEYKGADLVSPLDVSAGATGTSTTSSSGAVATTSADDLLLGANYVATKTTGPGTGFTKRLITSPDGDIVEDENVTETGAYSATAPIKPSGWWVMQMVAFRAAGLSPPEVSITSPVNNATVSGTVEVDAMAMSGVGIASVQLQVDGVNVGAADTSSPYDFSWNSASVANGTHVLAAVAIDASGVSATSPSITVTVSNSVSAPTVSITSPANGATVSGTITVSANASSSIGIASVQLQVDGNNVGAADTSSPYNFSWNTTSYTNGSYALTAVATDTEGNSTVSAAVNVTVSNSSSGGGGGFPTTLGWYDISGQQLAGNCPPTEFGYDFAAFCSGVVDAWNSAIADTTRNRLWIWGGGHNDYAGNEIYYFDLTSQAVVRANNPADPTPTCADAFSNGTPSSRHTYGGTVYIPTADVMFVFGGVPWCSSGGFISDTWALALSEVGSSGTGGWTQLTPTIAGNGGVGPSNQFGNSQLQYDPNTGLVFLNESTYGLWSYNYSTDTYTFLASAPSNISLHEGTVIDPVHKLFLRFGDGHAESISIAPGSSYAVTTLKATNCNTLASGNLEGNNPGLQWDPVLQLVVGWPNFGPGVYLYNPVTDSCTTETYSTNAPPDSHMTGSASTTNGTFKRFGYFPAFGVYALMNEWDIDVHALRLTPVTTPGVYSPANGATLTSSTQTFLWYAASGASAYYLDLGPTEGSNAYLDSGSLPSSQLSYTANYVPTNGSTIWARWYYNVGGTWSFIDYSYSASGGAPGGDTLATMASPTPGSSFSSSSVTFTWNAGVNAQAYYLDVGSSSSINYYYSQNQGLGTSATVNNLPTDGSAVIVTLYTLLNGTWYNNQYTYTAANTTLAVMTSPTPGSMFSGATVTFTWSPAGASVQAYYLDIGTSSQVNLYYSQNQGLNTSATVNGLPTNGNSVVVTLYSEFAGTWYSNQYNYTAFNPASGAATMLSPTPGSTFSGSSVAFTWNGVNGAQAYYLDIGTASQVNAYYSQNQGLNTTVTVGGLPADGSQVNVTLYTEYNGAWYSNLYIYTAQSFTLAAMTAPSAGSPLNGSSQTFTWSAASSGVQAYYVDIGTSTSVNFYYSQNQGLNTSVTVSGLPVDGSTVYVTLYSEFSGQWQSNLYTFPAALPAAITSPANGATLSGSSQAFNWTTGNSVSSYALAIGSTPGGTDIYTANEGTNTQDTVNTLPTNGQTLYVTLTSMIEGQPYSNSYTYTAASQ
jgi:hypothetical protein